MSDLHKPVVNSVDMSSDGHYLVAVTDNNLVCIWCCVSASTNGDPGTTNPSAAFPTTIFISNGDMEGNKFVVDEARNIVCVKSEALTSNEDEEIITERKEEQDSPSNAA